MSAAYHLALNRAAQVVVIEKQSVGSGSSSRAAGITTGLLWSETGVLARQLGIQWFRRLSQELPGYAYHDEQGCLNLFTPEIWAERVPLLPLYDRLDKEYQVLTAAEISRRWPALHPPEDFMGLHDPSGGYSEPDEYIAALVLRLRQLRVEIVEGQQVEGFLVSSGRIVGVRTSTARFDADAVISGIHSWSLLLWQKLGLRLPIKNFVHQRYVSAPLAEPFVAPPVNADPYLGYLRPARGGRILLGVETAERRQWDVDHAGFAMDELTVSTDVRDEAVQRFANFAPALRAVSWESQQVGLIAFSIDGEPIVGPVQSLPGLFVAGAFHSGGFSYNTVAGLLLAEMATGKPPSVNVAAFSPDRFSAVATEGYLKTTLAQSQAIRRRH
ncbi:MAG: FAD-binding oxidoreductase [Pirellulales bacterium]|nr:FAD-binding oxidoreductase [Pirellulales bacterium]